MERLVKVSYTEESTDALVAVGTFTWETLDGWVKRKSTGFHWWLVEETPQSIGEYILLNRT
jgi:hypothetical protein